MAVTSARTRPAPTPAGSGTPRIPRIRRGEIKNVKSYREALKQLATRPDVAGNTALVLYDDAGRLHLQVFKKDERGVRTIGYDRPIGSVTIPIGVRPGTAPFGNAIEPLILAHLARITGQRFRSKRANAGGPDIDAYELMEQGEVSVGNLCAQASRLAEAIRGRIQRAVQANPLHRPIIIDRVRRKGSEWLGRVVRQLEPTLGTIPVERIDPLIGCLARVEHAMKRTHPGLSRLRRAAAARIAAARGGIR